MNILLKARYFKKKKYYGIHDEGLDLNNFGNDYNGASEQTQF